MTCDLCDEKATVFLTQIVDGKMQKINLCESCAKQKGVTDPTGFALADLLLGLGKTESTNEPHIHAKSSGSLPDLLGEQSPATCKVCGFSQAQFKKAGRLGCPSCYEIFGEGLESLLKAMHKGTRHVGKVPQRYQAMAHQHQLIDDLKSRLEKAVNDEAFEEAARLRDEIIKAEAELARSQEAPRSTTLPSER